MTDKSITSIYTTDRYDGPAPADVSVSFASIMPAFEANGAVLNEIPANYRGVSTADVEDLNNMEWWSAYYNPGFEGKSFDQWATTPTPFSPTRPVPFATRIRHQPRNLSMQIGHDYSPSAWDRAISTMRRNMYATMESDLIGALTATASGDGVVIQTILDSPGTNSDAANRPALLGSDADGGEAGSIIDASAIYLGASGTMRTLVATIQAAFTGVGIDPNVERIALFVPPPLFTALKILQCDTGISRNSFDVLSGAFPGGVWSTEWFHNRINSAVSTATNSDIVAVDMDRVRIAVLGGGIREVIPKTRELDIAGGKNGWGTYLDLSYGVQFAPVYDGTTFFKAVVVATGCTTAASA